MHIPYSTYTDTAEALCSKGRATEFLQPWYVPISTTPDNTGMAIGGIGSTFTLSPLGHTPCFNFLPGLFVENHDPINLSDFYLATSPTESPLCVTELGDFIRELEFYPAQWHRDVEGDLTEEWVNALLNQEVSAGQFFLNNQDNIARWQQTLSPATLAAIAVDPASPETQRRVLLDVYDGKIGTVGRQAWSLNAYHQGEEKVSPVSASQIRYQALYPIAQYDYDLDAPIQVRRQVISPIVKNQAELCSLPVHWNRFSFTNTSDQVQSVTLVQALDNLIGASAIKSRAGQQDSACHLSLNPVGQHNQALAFNTDHGMHFSGLRVGNPQTPTTDIHGEMALGVVHGQAERFNITVKPTFYTELRGKHIDDALASGRVNAHFNPGTYSGREKLTGCVCVSIELQPGESAECLFLQAIDTANIEFDGLSSQKRYASLFKQDDRMQALLQYTMQNISRCESEITAQQETLLTKATEQLGEPVAAEKFATMACNTLSFLAESSVWDVEDRFLVKECADYPFFNSLDVYFYGSFALLYLLPELDGKVMAAFTEAIMTADDTSRRHWEYAGYRFADLKADKYAAPRGVQGAVIHDLGSPFDIAPDAYSWHNVKTWKDLAPKYIMMVYRHAVFTGNEQIWTDCWPAITASIDYLQQMMGPGDVLPLTHGTDDTFDNLSSHGISIYCGTLWVAGLLAAKQIAIALDHPVEAQRYQAMADSALAAINHSLWDEQHGYFHFYTTPVEATHLSGVISETLLPLGIELNGGPEHDVTVLNAYLSEALPDGEARCIEKRRRKHQLLELAPEVFTEGYHATLDLESDNSFGDSLLADSYLRLLGLEGIFDPQQSYRTMDYIYHANFKQNSPLLGVANMVLADGQPHAAFQAQDVWTGVQFSFVNSLLQNGKREQANHLIETVYESLYEEGKIPFAAPEGFNCSDRLTAAMLAERYRVSMALAEQWIEVLKTQVLFADGRVRATITADVAEFSALLQGELWAGLSADDRCDLFAFVRQTGMKYTAGRYFRPGMIFSCLPELLYHT